MAANTHHYPGFIADCVAGKNWFCLSCLIWVSWQELWLAFGTVTYFCSYNHTLWTDCLRGPYPSAWLELKWLCLAHREIIWPYPPVSGCKKEEINTCLPEAGHSWRCFARLMGLFTLLCQCLPLCILSFYFSSSPLLSLVLPKILSSRPHQDGYFEILVVIFLVSQLSE